jgi:hypothetical protein
MTAQPARRRVTVAALVLVGVTVLATTACASASADPTGGPAKPSGRQSIALPFVVNCSGQTLVRPPIYLVGCADGNPFVGALNWSAWGSSSALASGTSVFNDCAPTCLAGRNHTFAALIVLWGARALPGHAGRRYFSEMTIVYTGHRAYTADGQKRTVPQTQTYPLSNLGGACGPAGVSTTAGAVVPIPCN